MTRELAIALVLAGCGRVGFDPTVDAAADASVVPVCASWGPSSHLAELGGGADDWEPAIHPGGQVIVFASSRTGRLRLYQATRQGATWTTPVELTTLSSTDDDSGPAWNADGTRLYFTSNRAGIRLYLAAFDGVAFSAPTLVPGLETIDGDALTVSGDERELVFTTPLNTSVTLARATRDMPSGTWQYAGRLVELDAMDEEGWPSLASDDRTLYFESKASGTPKIVTATRAAIGAPFGPATVIPELDDPIEQEGDPEVSRDGREILFARSVVGLGPEIFRATCSD